MPVDYLCRLSCRWCPHIQSSRPDAYHVTFKGALKSFETSRSTEVSGSVEGLLVDDSSQCFGGGCRLNQGQPGSCFML